MATSNTRSRPASAPKGETKAAPVHCSRPLTAAPKAKQQKDVGSIRAALARLTHVAPAIELPANPPFPGVESEAHFWGVPMTLKYLREELELPEYEDVFLRAEMTGLKFICLDADLIRKTLQLNHILHMYKVDSHAERLRERVLEKAVIQRPSKLEQWAPWHVAGWLRHKLGCKGPALFALRSKLDGEQVTRFDESELVRCIGGEGSEEAANAIAGLMKLRESRKKPSMVEQIENLVTEDSATPSEKENKPPTSRVKSKRLQESAAEAAAEAAAAGAAEATSEKVEATPAETSKALSSPETCATEPECHQEVRDNKLSLEDAVTDRTKTKKSKARKSKGDGAHVPAAAAPNDESVKLAEKIEALQLLLQNQQASMKQLEEAAAAAKREKADAERRLNEEKTAAMKLQASLRNDLGSVSMALDTVSEQYVSDMQAFKKSMAEELRELQTDTKEIERTTERVKAHRQSTPAHDDVSAAYNTVPAPIPASSSVSIPSSSVLRDAAETSKVDSPVAPLVAKHELTAIAESSLVQTTAMELHIQEPVASSPTASISAQPPIPVPAPALVHIEEKRFSEAPLTSIRPLAAASALLGTAPLDPTDEVMLQSERSLKSVLRKTAKAEIKVWKTMLRRYQHAKSTTLTVPDTTAQLSRITCLWLRLGMMMLDDSRAKPSLPSPSEEQRVTVAAKEEEEEEEDRLEPLCAAEIEALRGLQRCSRCLLQMHAEAEARDSTQQLPLASAACESSSDINQVSAPMPHRSAPSMSNRRHDYEIAVGMVFALGLARRIMDRYPDKKDQTNLLFLLTRLREGSLPLSELSRENLRALLLSTLNISLPDWAQFDSICQRFDPEGKGWVTAQRTLAVFSNLNPLGDSLGPGDGQGLAMLLLSLSSSCLAHKGKLCQDAFLELVISCATRVASFAALAKGEFDKEKDDRHRVPALKDEVNENDEDKGNQVTDGVAPVRTARDEKRSKLADETHLVRDLLYELSKDFISKQHTNSKPASLTGQSQQQTDRRSSGSKEEWRRVRPSSSCPLNFIPPTPSNLSAACHLVSRVLSVYEGRGSQLLTAMGTLLSMHLTFRRACLLRMRAQAEVAERTQLFPVAVGHSSTAGPPVQTKVKLHPKMHMTLQQVLTSLRAVESSLSNLLGEVSAAMTLKRADSMQIEEHERLVAELAGIPVPHNGVLGLVMSQCEVETYLYHQLAKMQQESDQTPLEHIAALIPTGPPQAGSPTKRKNKGETHAGLLDGMNVLMFRQRVEQAAQYLEHLNTKAHRKRKLLESAMQLWQASKELGMSPSKKKHTRPLGAMNITCSTGASMEGSLLGGLGPQEISKRAADLQTATLDDLLKLPAAPLQQLAARITGIKRGVMQGSIADKDQSLVIMLREISVLEEGLLQANDDVMAVIDRIQEKCAVYI